MPSITHCGILNVPRPSTFKRHPASIMPRSKPPCVNNSPPSACLLVRSSTAGNDGSVIGRLLYVDKTFELVLVSDFFGTSFRHDVVMKFVRNEQGELTSEPRTRCSQRLKRVRSWWLHQIRQPALCHPLDRRPRGRDCQNVDGRVYGLSWR